MVTVKQAVDLAESIDNGIHDINAVLECFREPSKKAMTTEIISIWNEHSDFTRRILAKIVRLDRQELNEYRKKYLEKCFNM